MSQTPLRPSPPPAHEYWGFFAAALVLKLLFWVVVSDSPFVTELTNDKMQHWSEALGIISTGFVRPDAFNFAPLYPYLLAAIFAVAGPSLTIAPGLNLVLGAATLALTFALAFVMTGRRRPARLVAICVMLFGPFYLHEVLLLKTTASPTLTVAAVLMLMLARQRDRPWLWLVSGHSFGPLTALAAAGMWLRRGLWWRDLPVWAAVVASVYRWSCFLFSGGIECRWAEFAIAAVLISTINAIALIPVPEDSTLISYSTLGGLYLRQGRAEETRECFERVAAAAPDNAAPRVNLALALERLGKMCEAAENRRMVEDQWWQSASATGDPVFLIQYLESTSLLLHDIAACDGSEPDPILVSRMRSVAQELDARRRQGRLQPTPNIEHLIKRTLLVLNPGENGISDGV